jgi:nucleotide-binding universal stress UspA family protein
MYQRILIAYDGSEGAEKALRAALSMAREYSAELQLVAVEERLPHYAATADEMDAEKQQLDRESQRLCARAKAEAAAAGLRLTPHILAGHPGRVIPRLAKELGSDLVVAGFHGHSALHDRLFGSTCLEIISHSDCSVLVVK